MKIHFPPVEMANADGLLCVGGKVTPQSLHDAYHQGIFPWPMGEDIPLTWFAPPRRGVLFFDQFHIPRSTRKMLRRADFQYAINTTFSKVLLHCANRPEGTWITPEIMEGYSQLHRCGHAHSVEVYNQGTLVGGLYGVSWGKYFCGESMFHLQSGASKAALVYLVDYLKERGFSWIDIQNISPLFALFGACEIPREEFMELLLLSVAIGGSSKQW